MLKIMPAVRGFKFLLSLVEICNSFPKSVDELCDIFSSKNIVQPGNRK